MITQLGDKCEECGTVFDAANSGWLPGVCYYHLPVECVAALKERIKELELDLHVAIVSEREAEARAVAADVIVLRVGGDDAHEGEIDVFTDGHSHHYVPASMISRQRFVCPDCGFGVKAENGCCGSCGRDCAVVAILTEPKDMIPTEARAFAAEAPLVIKRG